MGKLIRSGGQLLPSISELRSVNETIESALIESGDLVIVETKINARWIVDELRVPKTRLVAGPLLPPMDEPSEPLFKPGSDFFSSMTPASSTQRLLPAPPPKPPSIGSSTRITIPSARALEKARTPGTMGLGNMYVAIVVFFRLYHKPHFTTISGAIRVS